MLAERDEAGRDIVRASGFGDLDDLKKRLPNILQDVVFQEAAPDHPYKALVKAYFDGDKEALSKIPSMQEGSEFYRSAWQVMSRVAYGQTMTYKELAAASGRPAAIRAAGTVCGLNRLILLVPCHRIVKSGGGIGNYLYGSDIKTYLLRHEGAIV